MTVNLRYSCDVKGGGMKKGTPDGLSKISSRMIPPSPVSKGGLAAHGKIILKSGQTFPLRPTHILWRLRKTGSVPEISPAEPVVMLRNIDTVSRKLHSYQCQHLTDSGIKILFLPQYVCADKTHGQHESIKTPYPAFRCLVHLLPDMALYLFS